MLYLCGIVWRHVVFSFYYAVLYCINILYCNVLYYIYVALYYIVLTYCIVFTWRDSFFVCDVTHMHV